MTFDPDEALHVLTVHYNTPDLTSRLVREFPRITPRGRRVFIHILDNSSEPENLRMLQQATDGVHGTTLDVSDRNVGFGEGINCLASRNDIQPSHVVWLLNPDTRLEPGCLGELEAELDSGRFDVVSPLIFSGDGDEDRWIWYCGGDINVRQLRVTHQLYGSSLGEAGREPFETGFVTGAAPMMRADTFHDLGGFRRGYFMYWEDAYFSWQARGTGRRLGVVPAAHLWHAVGASSGYGKSRSFYYWSTRNRFTFAGDIGLSRWQVVGGRRGVECFRPIAHAIREREGRLSKVRHAIRGTLDGFLGTQRVPS
ncbi:glycosyltransferase family 2 protein [Mycobacterium sp. DL592]|uniref:glycosyltransferase family 2 protein n=1 Tax=Mycobacterium sp. DL592 TaxID=2675524 RepID=UPI0014240656|nr:glycosyltransferase family 2 protein [Mycobacterium sp. DL592]